jgi:hypothetical protein
LFDPVSQPVVPVALESGLDERALFSYVFQIVCTITNQHPLVPLFFLGKLDDLSLEGTSKNPRLLEDIPNDISNT